MSTKYHPLTEWALEQQKKWKGLKETDKEALEILKEYNKRIGTKFNPSDHWSAITIENARMAANGFKSVEEAKKAGVNLSHKSHSGYVNDGFKAVQDPNYKYNKYISERIDDSEIKIGDYLVGGREGTKNWKFEDFEKAAKNNSGYESHGSAVVFKGIDNNGEYVILADGNWDDTYANRKVYVKDLAAKGYAVKVTDTNPTSNSQVEQSSTRRSPLDISLERSEDVEDTNEVIEDTEDTEDDSVLDEGPTIEEQLQYATSSGSSNQFRLSDEAQMQLFGTIVYPRNAEGASIISPEGDLWEYKKEGDDFYTKKKEDEEWIPTDGAVSNNIKENIFNESCEDGSCKDEGYSDINPFENLQAEYAEKEKREPWWKTAGYSHIQSRVIEEAYMNYLDGDLSLEDFNKIKERDIKSRSYTKDPYIAYLDGDMSTEDYKKYLRTTPQFRSDFDRVVDQLDGFEERNGQAYTNSVGGTSYKLTADQKKYRRKIATDFAKKYGYSIESFPTEQQMADDESLNLIDDGLLNMYGNLLREDLKTYDSKWKRVNELKSGFEKAGYQVDGDYNIRWGGYAEGNINDIIDTEKETYSFWDFEANDGKGDFVFDGSNEGVAYYANEDCKKLGKVFDVKTGVCVDDPYGFVMRRNADLLKPEYETDVTGRYAVKAPGQYESYMERYGHMPQGTGSSDQFWLATLLGPSSIPGVVGSLTAETAITPFIDPGVDFAFDAIDMVSGNPIKQAAAFTKYAAPIERNWNAAVRRYNKADGFFDSIGAFFNLEEGGPVGALPMIMHGGVPHDDLITYKNNKNLIDSVANWDMQSDVDISSDYNDQIKARLLTGNYGFNPKTGELVKLGKSQQTKVTDKEALQTKGDLISTKREDAKQKLMDDYTANRKLVSIDKADEWNPYFVIKDEYGRDINTQDFAGKQVYMTDAEHEAYKKARIGHNAPIMQNKMNNVFRAAASFTPMGIALNAVDGLAHLTMDVPELIKDPSWSNAGNVFMDALMASPVVLPPAISTAKNIKNVKLPYPKMDPNKIALSNPPIVPTPPLNPPKPVLQIKSTMPGGPLEKQLSKTGEINVKNIQAHINKADVSKQDKFILQKTLDENFAGQTKINYEDFKKAVSENLVPLEKTKVDKYSSYGVDKLNYKKNKSIENNLEYDIRLELNKQNYFAKSRQLDDLDEAWRKQNTLYQMNPVNNLKYNMSRRKLAKDAKFFRDRYDKLVSNPPRILPSEVVSNETILYGNANKFGKAKDTHFAEEPLGHTRTLVTKQEPDVMHFLETQSDWAQGSGKTNISELKKMLEIENKQLAQSKQYLEDMIDAYEKGEKFGVTTYSRGFNVEHQHIKNIQKHIADRKKIIIDLKNTLKNPEQKNFLLGFYQERLLQENMLHAVKQGQSIMRYPTTETVAKIQGYTPEILKRKPSLQTILNKYKNTPKMIKKVLGVDVKTVTDVKGNTWYEWAIPEDFLQGTRPIRALKYGGAYGPGDEVSPVNITSYYNFGTPRTPEEWEQEIRTVEREIGNPRGWTMDDYNTMQDKLNEYKAWREKNTWVRDSSNKPNEYVIPLPPHLNGAKHGGQHGGEDDVIRPKGDPYEYKKVGDKYYTRRREGEWESEEQPGWDLATGESEDAIKYKVFKEARPEPVAETTVDERFPSMTYDPNDPNDFYARYYSERKLDQSQDALKPEYFNSNYKLDIPEWMDVNNNDEEYELWKAQTFKPGRRAPSWLEKNVFKPIGKEIDKFQKTDFGPIGDMTEFAYDMIVDPVVTLASDFYNEPNQTATEVMQMMADGFTLPVDAAAETIRTNVIEPEEEFNTSTLGSPTSIERAGQVLAIAPWVPPVAKAVTKGGKTAKVVSAVDGAADDVVNVSNKKVISRPGTKKNFEAAPAGSSKPTMSAEEIQAIESSPYMKNQTQYKAIAERDYNRLVRQNPNHPIVKQVESGDIQLLKMNDPANPYSGFKLTDENFASIDNQVKLKLDRSKSVEGRKRIFEQEKAYIKEQYPEMSDNLINDAAEQATKARIAELEDLYRTKNYGIEWTGNNELMNAYHSPGQAVSDVTNKNPIGVSNFEKTVTPVNRGQRIEFHPGNVDDAATIQHELGHGYSAGRDLPIEKEIMDLMEDASSKLNAKDKRAYNYLVKDNAKKNDLIKRMREHDPANKNLTDAELIDKYSKYGQSKQPLGKEDWTFSNEIESIMGGSSEAIPYAQELKQVLLDQGLIDDWFQEVTPSMLAKSNALNKAQPRGLYFADMTGQMTDDLVVATNTRLLDLTNPAKYGDLAKILNKIAPVASVPIAAGTMLDNN